MKRNPAPDPSEFDDVAKKEAQEEALATMTTRQRNTALAYMGDPSISKMEACKRGGYKVAPNSRIQQVFRIIESKLGAVLRKEFGVTDIDVARVVFDAMRAEKTHVSYRKKFKDGKVITSEPVVLREPDHNIRLKAISLAVKSPLKSPLVNIDLGVRADESSVAALNARAKQGAVEADFEVTDVVS